jgi:ATP-dependent Clp protease protease subunit
MSEDQNSTEHAWFTLSGDVNSDMVHRVFDAVADMTEDRIETAHILMQSNGGYVSDGMCLYNYLRKLPIKIVMYNGGAVASIAVMLYLSGEERYASETARFMVHKSHASAPSWRASGCAAHHCRGPAGGRRPHRAILREHVQLMSSTGPCMLIPTCT